MISTSFKQRVYFSRQAADWLVGEAKRLDVTVNEVVRRIVDQHRDEVAERAKRRLRKGEPAIMERGGQRPGAGRPTRKAEEQTSFDIAV